MKRHLKSLAAPKSWTLLRKENKYVAKPVSSHPQARALPISLLLKQMGFADTVREVKKILNEKDVLVDGKAVMDRHFGVGFMDVIQIKKAKKNLRVSIDSKGRLTFIDIPDAETGRKVCKINGKRVVRGNKIQLNLSDGRNVLMDKGDYSVGDSVVVQVPEQKILEHFKLAKGASIYLMSGRHTAVLGVVDDIQGNRLWFKADGEKLETLKRFAFVVGKEKPVVKIR